MNKKGKEKVRLMIIGAMLTALGILIPMIMPIKLVIGPASFTLASHVPLMIAMFFGPEITAFVALGTTFGFMVAYPIPTIWLRALTHLVFGVGGAIFLKRHPEIVATKGKNVLKNTKFQLFNLVIALIHALFETIAVAGFYLLGFGENPALVKFLIIIGCGTIIHSLIDFNIAYVLGKVLSTNFSIHVFDKSREKIQKAEVV